MPGLVDRYGMSAGFKSFPQTAYEIGQIIGFLKQSDCRHARRAHGKTGMSVFSRDAANRENWNAHRPADFAEPLDSLRRSESRF